MNSLKTKVNANTTQINDIIKSVDFESAKTQDYANETQKLKSQLQPRESQFDNALYPISSMSSNLNPFERYSRIFNLRIFDLPITIGENCIGSVRQILKDIFDIEAPVIENAHRMGISCGDKPRQMVARFVSQATRWDVMISSG